MARMVVRASPVSIALALAGSVVHAQSRHQSVISATHNSEAAARQNARIVSLIERLADQARTSEDMPFSVRAQSQAAALLWPQDAAQARTIYRRAFKSLAAGGESKPLDSGGNANTSAALESIRGLTSVQKQQLRGELLNQIAARDPELAEDLARGLADSLESSKHGCADDASADCSASGASSSRAPAGPL